MLIFFVLDAKDAETDPWTEENYMSSRTRDRNMVACR